MFSAALQLRIGVAHGLHLIVYQRPLIQVLIAEDDPHVRSLVIDVVKELGHSPTCANDGEDALALFNDRGADVVVSDWMMPRMDGVELCRCVRARPGTPYTYFILLTALGDSEHRMAGMQAGADDYLAKPFDIDEIEARLIAAERVTVVHRRREALFRLARRFAAEADPNQLLDDLLSEAIDLVGGCAGVVTRWDTESQMLVPVGAIPRSLQAQRWRLGQRASGRAAEQRKPVFLRRDEADGVDPLLDHAHVDLAIAVPLLHEARLVGALAIGSEASSHPGKAFSRPDAELLELLASTASAALVALEHARLDGVLLAARTAQHELNNQLAVARGYAEMLVGSPELPPHLHEMAEEVMNAADDAADIVRQMRNISSIHEKHWNDPTDTTINLAASQGERRVRRKR